MDSLVSILIPTYKRPFFIQQAIQSIFKQDYRPLEILIGDDSPDIQTQEIVQQLKIPSGVDIKYGRNNPGLGQSENINSLLDAAVGKYCLVLHDDDMLLPNAITSLRSSITVNSSIIACYGKQRLCAHDGSDCGDNAADELNSLYNRTSQSIGIQPDAFIAAICRQFPNDGFLVKTSIAKQVKYRHESEIGHAVDTDFGIRLALATSNRESFRFIDDETCVYRLSNTGVSASGSGATASFWEILEEFYEKQYAAVIAEVRRLIAPGAANDFVRHGQRSKAFRVWLHSAYGNRRYTPRGIYCLATICLPALQRIKKRLKPLNV